MIRLSRLVGPFMLATLLLAGCGGSSAPSSSANTGSSPVASKAPAASSSSSAASSSAAASASAAPALQHIKITWVAKVANMAPAWVALDAGYYQQQGLDPELNYINGSPTGMAALVAGDTDFLEVAGSAVVGAAAGSKGGKKPVLILGTVNKSVWKLMAQKDITSLDQLKGKTLAVSKLGSADDYALRIILKRKGIDPSQVKIVAGGSIQGEVAMLTSKQVEAGVVSTPVTVLLQHQGLHSILDFSKEDLPNVQLGAAVMSDYAQAHPDTVLRFVKAYIQGIHRFKTDKAFAEAAMRKYLDVQNQEELDDAWTTYKDVFEEVPIPSTAAVQTLIDATQQASGMPPSDFVNDRFVKQAQQEGFIKQVYGS